MVKIKISVLITIFILGCGRYSAKDNTTPIGTIKGKAVYQNKGISGAVVYAYKKDEKGFSLLMTAVSLPADENGNFLLELRNGIYYLVVKKDNNYGYFGGNPVAVSAGRTVELTINCVKKNFSKETDLEADTKPGISGMVYYEDRPLDKAEVFFYLSMENDLRGPAYFSAATDEKGKFYAPLESGTYYIVCRKRMGEGQFGPIQPGDFFGYYEGNPVSVKQGEHRNIELYTLKKELTRESFNIITPSGMISENQTFISGRVYDIKRNPVQGVYVCLYKKDEMVGKPEYISDKTTEDGFFQINLISGGKFYLIAKQNFGIIPKPNDFIGYLSDSRDHSIEIGSGRKLINLEIVGERILSR
ncbi:MAG: hypothetical protein AB1498_12320 [bacterium]